MATKSFRFRLNPTTTQLEPTKSYGGAARWIWNQKLTATVEKYEVEQKFNFRGMMNKLVTEL